MLTLHTHKKNKKTALPALASVVVVLLAVMFVVGGIGKVGNVSAMVWTPDVYALIYNVNFDEFEECFVQEFEGVFECAPSDVNKIPVEECEFGGTP